MVSVNCVGCNVSKTGYICGMCCLLQVSFVNSINTSRGGTHVTYIADQVRLEAEARAAVSDGPIPAKVVSAILEKIGKQKSGGSSSPSRNMRSDLFHGGPLAVKSQHVKSYLWIFVNCLAQLAWRLVLLRHRLASCRAPECPATGCKTLGKE